MATKTTFTYINLATKNPVIQHEIKKVEHLQTDGPHVNIKLVDVTGRKLHIVTNQPYHFRQEETSDAAPLAPSEPAHTTSTSRPLMEVESDTD